MFFGPGRFDFGVAPAKTEAARTLAIGSVHARTSYGSFGRVCLFSVPVLAVAMAIQCGLGSADGIEML